MKNKLVLWLSIIKKDKIAWALICSAAIIAFILVMLTISNTKIIQEHYNETSKILRILERE